MNSLKINAALAAPTLTYASTASTGGTLADSTTYFYRVSAIMAYGPGPTIVESLAVAQGAGQAVSSGTATNTVTITWTAVPGAVGYNVYGRLTGAAKLLATVNALTFTDTGATAYPLGTQVVLTTSTALAGNSFLPGGNAGTLLFNGAVTPSVAASPFTAGRVVTVVNVSGGALTLTGSADGITFTNGAVVSPAGASAGGSLANLSFTDIVLPNFLTGSAAGLYILGSA